MQAAYQEFAKDSKELKARMQHDMVMTKPDVKSIKKMDIGIRFMNRLSKREFYQIPVDTGSDIVNMNVTILQKGEERVRCWQKFRRCTLEKFPARRPFRITS